jgi:hypothetical protein
VQRLRQGRLALGPQLEARADRRHVAGRRDLQLGLGTDESTRQIYVLDVIVGHCGGNPGAFWLNQTGVGGADARWTLSPTRRPVSRADLSPSRSSFVSNRCGHFCTV